MLAVSQFLADEGKIILGELPEEQLIIQSTPLILTAPYGIKKKPKGTKSSTDDGDGEE